MVITNVYNNTYGHPASVCDGSSGAQPLLAVSTLVCLLRASAGGVIMIIIIISKQRQHSSSKLGNCNLLGPYVNFNHQTTGSN